MGCENCRAVLGHKNTAIYHKDPGIYTYLKKYRKVLKKDRVRPADLSDDPSSLVITKQKLTTDMHKENNVSQIELDKIKKEQNDARLRKLEQEDLERFYVWKK